MHPANEILRLAQHLVSETVAGRCKLTAFPGEAREREEWKENRGRCPHDAVAIRWEDGFADAVCERHAVNAEDRGALVVRPERHDGNTAAEETRDGIVSVEETIAHAATVTLPNPVRVTFVTWDAESDGVAVEHDGQRVWTDQSLDGLDQYRHLAPTGPVLLEFRADD